MVEIEYQAGVEALAGAEIERDIATVVDIGLGEIASGDRARDRGHRCHEGGSVGQAGAPHAPRGLAPRQVVTDFTAQHGQLADQFVEDGQRVTRVNPDPEIRLEAGQKAMVLSRKELAF